MLKVDSIAYCTMVRLLLSLAEQLDFVMIGIQRYLNERETNGKPNVSFIILEYANIV